MIRYPMHISKVLRSSYFRKNDWVKNARKEFGEEYFDNAYRAYFKYVTKNVEPGQHFSLYKICKDSSRIPLVIGFLDIMNSMDVFEHLILDIANMSVTRSADIPEESMIKYRREDGSYGMMYTPVDIYSQIIKSPERWGISPEDILNET